MERMTMNVTELAQQLGISKPKAYELVNQESFPALRLGKRIIIPVAALENYLMDNATRSRNIARR